MAAPRKQRRDLTRSMARCNWHEKKNLGYVSWHDWAAAKTKAGEKQKKCPDCGRVFFKEEWGKPPRTVLEVHRVSDIPPIDKDESLVQFADLKKKPLELKPKSWFQGPKKKNGMTCYHHSVLIDENMAYVECADCGEHLNPMKVLYMLATEENRFAERRADLVETMKVFETKSKTKCQHCGKFTNLREK